MIDATIYTVDTAPEASKPLLEKSLQEYGMVPNLHAVMAESPEFLEGYRVLHGLFTQTSFTTDEKTVVWQTINVEHGCHYCVPAHTAVANMMGASDGVNDALRNETPLPTAKLEALRTFTLAVVRTRGQITPEDMKAFLDAGYTQQNVFEVILGLAQKVMSNYTNHIAATPVDAPFAVFEWQKAAE